MSAIQSAAPDIVSEEAVFRKITARCAPLLFICFVFNYMDRTNIGFAQLQIKGDLGFNDVAYGFGASIFFVSYSLFAFPSNLLMTKIGAPKVLSASLFLWGITSACTMFIRTPKEFYAIRFLLGAVESGFFPGVIFYFAKWYPSHRRANVTGVFQSATVVAGVLSGVLSGALMTYLNGYAGLRGWQWMFLVEGLPCAILGVIVLFYLDDRPQNAKWLSDDEKKVVVRALKNDPASSTGHQTLGKALLDWKVYLLGVIFFLAVIGTYVLAFWQPTMIKEFGVSSIMLIGLYSTIPSIAAVIAKIWFGYDSDKKKELKWHFAVPAFVGAFGMLLLPIFPHSPLLGILCLTLATAGVHGCIPVFWSVPGLYLSGTAAAGGIAVISTMGNLSGAVGPLALGFIKSKTGSFNDGMYIMAVLLAVGAVLVLAMVSARSRALRLAAATAADAS